MYDDYYYSYEYAYDTGSAVGGFIVFWYFVALVIGVISIVSLWRLYKMAGHPGWASLVPFYNNYVMFDIVYGKGVYFLGLLIPVVGQLWALYTLFKFAKCYNKSDAFAVGLIFFSPVFLPMMAFSGNTYYSGPSTAYIDSTPPGFGSSGGYGNGFANQPINTSGYDIYQGNQSFKTANFQQQGNGFQSQNNGFQGQNNGFQSQNNGFQSQNNGFRQQGGGSFDPHNANSYVDRNPYDSYPNGGNNGGF